MGLVEGQRARRRIFFNNIKKAPFLLSEGYKVEEFHQAGKALWRHYRFGVAGVPNPNCPQRLTSRSGRFYQGSTFLGSNFIKSEQIYRR